MKILITSRKLPPVAGGAEKVAWETAKRINKFKGVEVSILTTSSEKKDLGVKKREGVTVYTIPRVSNKLSDLYYSTIGYKHIKLLVPDNFDIIHHHIARPFVYAMRKYKGTKIVTCHGSDIYPKKFFKGIHINKVLKKCADIVTAPSMFFVNYLEVKYDINGIYVPNGIDTKRFKPLNIQEEPNFILYIGRYIKRKGLEWYLKNIKELPGYDFYFAGAGPMKESINLKNTIDLGMLDKDLVKVYNKANICVFPSVWENLPIVGLEAMACEKAIIATKIGFSEIIDNNKTGILIDYGNDNQLRDAINKLMKNKKLREKLGKTARKKALEFDYDQVAKRYHELYFSSPIK